MEIKIDQELFKDYPIEFKEINPEDFLYSYQEDGTRVAREVFTLENDAQKIIIEPNEQGFINEVLQEKILLDHKNTVVVNAAVGQGKSFAIIQTIKRYYDKMKKGGQQYLIFVASPFVSLVKQYCEDIKEAGIPEDQIYDYNDIGRSGEHFVPFLNKCVHVITANTLLGNPGEDGFKNSNAKRYYLNKLVAHSKAKNLKVIFIYDEIHDSYHNFRQEYVFNLWKWREVIHKNFVISATFNEASKVVIEYLAELTDKRIKIIESKRVRFPEKQSDLYLYYSSERSFTPDTPEIKDVITDLVKRGKNIDILCYSKTLSQKILDKKGELGKLLKEKFGELKDCTSELISNQRPENVAPRNQYDSAMCNIGANFKTGVSIKKDNHAFVIIMPPRSTRDLFRNASGIFSGGINSVIQALARQRTKGEIHIILGTPDEMDFSSIEQTQMNEDQRKIFMKIYNFLKHHQPIDKKAEFIKLDRQDEITREFYYKKLKANLKNEIDYIDNLERKGDFPRLQYPSYDEFKLEKGEDYLASEIQLFGEDISAYTTYAALTNQFVNCRLRAFNNRPAIFFREENLNRHLQDIINKFFDIDSLFYVSELGNYAMQYHDIRNNLFNQFIMKYKKTNSDKWDTILPYKRKFKEFETSLLECCALNKYGRGYEHRDKCNTGFPYTRSNYFLDCIKSLEMIETERQGSNQMFKLYSIVKHFRDKLIDSIQSIQTARRAYNYLLAEPHRDFFNTRDVELFNQFSQLINEDKMLMNSIFELKRNFDGKTTTEEKMNVFYKILIRDFFETSKTRLSTGNRSSIFKIRSVKELPSTSCVINLISPTQLDKEETDEMARGIIEHMGEEAFNEMNEEIRALLDKSNK